uniref:Uncharacterized protein n=1 Tax=Glossina austeni TaxID=7395 RepID=A0A1A9V1Y5_GLOAU
MPPPLFGFGTGLALKLLCEDAYNRSEVKKSSCIKSSRLSTRSRSVLPLPPLSLPPAPRSLPRSLLASPRVFRTSTLALRLAAAATAAATAAAAALALPTLGDRSPLVKPNAAAAADCKLALLLAAATAAAAAAAAAAAELRSLRLLLLRIKHDFAFYLQLFIEILSHHFYRKLLVAPGNMLPLVCKLIMMYCDIVRFNEISKHATGSGI